MMTVRALGGAMIVGGLVWLGIFFVIARCIDGDA